MARRKPAPPSTTIESTFFEAIERLERGKVRDGKRIKINVTNVSVEAGYARTYLYKFPQPRVMARIRSLMGGGVQPQTSRSLVSRLRRERDDAIAERDQAIDAARRWMHQCHRLRQDMEDLKSEDRRRNSRRENDPIAGS